MDVALFITCLTDTFYPRVGEAIVRVLRHFGCRVSFPAAQTCCGQPAYNSGFHAEAAGLVKRMTEVFADAPCVVTPSASCATMIKEHGPALLIDQPGNHRDAVALANKTHEFATFLTRELKIDIAAHLRFTEPFTFHYPCHARSTYTVDDLVTWLGGPANPALRIPERPDLCCGFGGMFAVEYPEVSGGMLADKLAQITATGTELVISNEAACTLQMAGGARRRNLPLRFKHLAECLAESLGLIEVAR